MNKDHAYDILASFLTNLALERGLAENSREAYQRDIGDLIEFCVTKEINDFKTLKPSDLSDYLGVLYDLGISSTTISRRLSAFRSFYKYLQRDGLVDENPAMLVAPPRQMKKLPDVLSVEEVTKFIDAVRKNILPKGEDSSGSEKERNRHITAIRDWAIFEVLYGCGLRVSELVNLKLDNIKSGGQLLLITGKGGRQRFTPVNRTTIKALKRYLDDSRPSLIRDTQAAGGAVFLSLKRGKPLTRQFIWKLVKLYADAAGIIKEVTPHTFRHSVATHMIEGGAGLRIVQEFLGHVSIETTDIYTHIDSQYLLETVRSYHPRK